MCCVFVREATATLTFVSHSQNINNKVKTELSEFNLAFQRAITNIFCCCV